MSHVAPAPAKAAGTPANSNTPFTRRAIGVVFELACGSSTWVGLLVLLFLIGILIWRASGYFQGPVGVQVANASPILVVGEQSQEHLKGFVKLTGQLTVSKTGRLEFAATKVKKIRRPVEEIPPARVTLTGLAVRPSQPSPLEVRLGDLVVTVPDATTLPSENGVWQLKGTPVLNQGRLSLTGEVECELVEEQAPAAETSAELEGVATPPRQTVWGFLSNSDSTYPGQAGLLAGFWGTFWVILFTVVISIPIGIGAALYLEEYATANWTTRFIQLNLANLAGVPSIVYGILGLTVFVRMFGMFKEPGTWKVLGLAIPLPLGASVLSGALTLSLLVLPVVIIATQEALRAVPPSIRHGSYALGATRWQTIWHQVLPAAVPGISTGVILAISRAIGETAPLIIIGVPTFLQETPGDIRSVGQVFQSPGDLAHVPFSSFTALPLVIYQWIRQADPTFSVSLSAAGILVLLAMLLALNGIAIFIRSRFQRQSRW